QVADHRQEHPAVRGAAHREDGAQLRAQQVRAGEARANAAQAERRVRFWWHRQVGDRLVSARIERADGERALPQHIGDLLVLGSLLGLARWGLAAEDQKLGARQSPALGAVAYRSLRLGQGADIGEHLDTSPVGRAALALGRSGERGTLCGLRGERRTRGREAWLTGSNLEQ